MAFWPGCYTANHRNKSSPMWLEPSTSLFRALCTNHTTCFGLVVSTQGSEEWGIYWVQVMSVHIYFYGLLYSNQAKRQYKNLWQVSHFKNSMKQTNMTFSEMNILKLLFPFWKHNNSQKKIQLRKALFSLLFFLTVWRWETGVTDQLTVF